MNEIEYLKVVRHTVASCRDFSRVLRVSDSADEPHSTRSRHCHELFEIRLLFGMLDATSVDYETLREIRLSPAGVAHPGLFENEHPAHITVRFDVDMLYYLRGKAANIVIPLNRGIESYGIGLGEALSALNAFCRREFTDAGHLQLVVAGVISALTLFLEQGDYRIMNEPVEIICNYIHEHYYRGNLTMAEVAAAAGLSPNYMQQVFRKVHHCTPLTYLRDYRLETARRLLRQRKYQVKEVAQLCGWNYPHYFDVCYRRKFGRTPLEEMHES